MLVPSEREAIANFGRVMVVDVEFQGEYFHPNALFKYSTRGEDLFLGVLIGEKGCSAS